jgi:hypothetical protein
VFDLKLSSNGAVWLELNPQGQFLFAEGLSGLPLMAAMSNYLRDEALTAADRSPRS